MDYQKDTTNLRKNKHLNFEGRMTIQLRLQDGFSTYKIAKELNHPINTIINEIRRGTTTQIKQGKSILVYLADTGKAIYEKNCQNSCCNFKLLEFSKFINYTVDKFKNAS